MSPKSISPVMAGAPGLVPVKMLVRVTSAWLRPAGKAAVASAAAARRGRTLATGGAEGAETAENIRLAEHVVGTADIPVQDAAACAVEQSLQGQAGAGGEGADLPGELSGDGPVFGRRTRDDGDEPGQARCAGVVDDAGDGYAGGGRDHQGQRQVGGGPRRVRHRRILHVDDGGILPEVRHLEHVAAIEKDVRVTL